jgi:hypothetical protein
MEDEKMVEIGFGGIQPDMMTYPAGLREARA